MILMWMYRRIKGFVKMKKYAKMDVRDITIGSFTNFRFIDTDKEASNE